MKTKIYVFENNNITFILDKDSRVMVNATEMAKAFGKNVYDFTRNKSTKEFIKACQKAQFRGLPGIEKGRDLIVSRQKSGTWMHRVLALKFAAWLNPRFDLWMYATAGEMKIFEEEEL
jgi:hypothetical protein